MAPVLQTERLSKHFGGIVATNDVSLMVEKGARHALIGRERMTARSRTLRAHAERVARRLFQRRASAGLPRALGKDAGKATAREQG